jgi:hypothetical protein
MKRSTMLYLIGGMAGCLTLGYLLGREHAEYSVRKALDGTRLNLKSRATDVIDTAVDRVRERVHI